MARLLFLLLSLSLLCLAKVELGRGPNSLAREAELELRVAQEGSQGEVRAVVHQPCNFTVSLGAWQGEDSLEVFWLSSGVYVEPRDPQGTRLVFTKAGPANQTVHLQADLIGVFTLRFYVLGEEGERQWVTEEMELVVKRDNLAMNKMITILFTLLISVALFFMGLELEVAVILATLKRPWGPLIGGFCQFVLMPGLGWVLGWAFLQTNYERLGLLLLACSPGGANSNFWTAMFHGDVNLSCTMTFLSTVASFAFTTLWVFLLGTPLVGKTIPIPFPFIALSLASFTVPLLLGIAFKYKWSEKAVQLKTRVSRPFFFVVLLILPAIASYNMRFAFYLWSWRHIISGVALGCCGYFFGAVFAAIFRQGRAQIIAISLETAMQNGGIAFLVLNLTFESPYSDMAVMPILSFFFFSTGPIIFLVYGAYLGIQKCRQRLDFSELAQEDKEGVEKL